MTIEIAVDGETHEVADPTQAGAVVTGALLANADEVEVTRDGSTVDHVIDRLDQLAGHDRTDTEDGDSEDEADADDVADAVEAVEDGEEDAEPDTDETLPEFEEAVGEDDDTDGEEQSDETFDCPDCERSFDTEQGRNHHRTSVHGDRDRLSDRAVDDMDEVLEDEETESEASADLGTYEVKSYGLVFTRDVQDFFTDDAERVTVRERDGRYELVPGPSEEWPDYAVSAAGIQVGNPGKDVLGVEEGDEVRARSEDEVVVLEVVGDEPDLDGEDEPEDDDDEDPDADEDDDGADGPAWCGVCGQGPFQTGDQVRDHHDRRDHPGEPVVRDEDPAEQLDAGDATTEESRTDGGAVAAPTPSTDAGTSASATCQNCGSQVTANYARVFAPDEEEGPRVCPNCEDKIREGDGTVREKRSKTGDTDE